MRDVVALLVVEIAGDTAIEMWLVTGGMIKVLEGFRHRSARRITGLTEKCGSGREC